MDFILFGSRVLIAPSVMPWTRATRQFLVPYACKFQGGTDQGGTDEVSESCDLNPAVGISSGFLALQSDGLGDAQPKNLLGLINAAQLKMSERLWASVTASRRFSKPR